MEEKEYDMKLHISSLMCGRERKKKKRKIWRACEKLDALQLFPQLSSRSRSASSSCGVGVSSSVSQLKQLVHPDGRVNLPRLYANAQESFRELQWDFRKVTSITCKWVAAQGGSWCGHEFCGRVQWTHYTRNLWKSRTKKRVNVVYNSYFEHLRSQ